MPEVKTQLVIKAPRQQVFDAFVDKARWHEYSTMKDLSPNKPIGQGVRFAFLIRVPGMPPAYIPVKVLIYDPGREVRWEGGVPGFRGEHYFQFEDAPGGGTLMTHGEIFSKALGNLFFKWKGETMTKLYSAFNEGLARHIRSRS